MMAQHCISTRCINNRHPLEQWHRQRPHNPTWALGDGQFLRRVAQHSDGIGGWRGTFGHHLAANDSIDETRLAGIEFTRDDNQKRIFEMIACLNQHMALSRIPMSLMHIIPEFEYAFEECFGAQTQ